MRKSLIVGTVAASLAVSGAALAVMPKHQARPAVQPAIAGPPGNSTAYEQAVTAYLNNVVNKARRRAAQGGPVAPPAAPAPSISVPSGYPGERAAHVVLPRVERITIGISREALLATPDGGRLRVFPGVMTPYGRVTQIRAAGVWFIAHGSHTAVQLVDVSAHEHRHGYSQQGMATGAAQSAQIPPPPNFQPGGQQ
jgi:hypothetical protein